MAHIGLTESIFVRDVFTFCKLFVVLAVLGRIGWFRVRLEILAGIFQFFIAEDGRNAPALALFVIIVALVLDCFRISLDSGNELIVGTVCNFCEE